MNTSPLQRFFADELRAAREEAGLSQDQLAAKMFMSKSLLSMVENCQRVPTPDFAKAVDEALATSGRFERARSQLLRGEATPEWFRPWVDFEQQATEIISFEPLLVPGLLQTEEYARALLVDGSPDNVENLLVSRMERQQVLERAKVSIVVDENVLHRQIGGRDIMYRQLKRLAETPASVQVLPSDAETYQHLLGSFTIATVDGGAKVGYLETPVRGFVIESPDLLPRSEKLWDIIRAEALPRRQSKDLILKEAESWMSN